MPPHFLVVTSLYVPFILTSFPYYSPFSFPSFYLLFRSFESISFPSLLSLNPIHFAPFNPSLVTHIGHHPLTYLPTLYFIYLQSLLFIPFTSFTLVDGKAPLLVSTLPLYFSSSLSYTIFISPYHTFTLLFITLPPPSLYPLLYIILLHFHPVEPLSLPSFSSLHVLN